LLLNAFSDFSVISLISASNRKKGKGKREVMMEGKKREKRSDRKRKGARKRER
jgi:hypothetical protein